MADTSEASRRSRASDEDGPGFPTASADFARTFSSRRWFSSSSSSRSASSASSSSSSSRRMEDSSSEEESSAHTSFAPATASRAPFLGMWARPSFTLRQRDVTTRLGGVVARRGGVLTRELKPDGVGGVGEELRGGDVDVTRDTLAGGGVRRRQNPREPRGARVVRRHSHLQVPNGDAELRDRVPRGGRSSARERRRMSTCARRRG